MHGDFDYPNDVFYLNIFDEVKLGDEVVNYLPLKSFKLNSEISDYCSVADLNIYYEIPKVKLVDFDVGKSYLFQLSSGTGSSGEIYASVKFTVTDRPYEEVIKDKQDIANDKLDEQNKKLEEQTNAIKDQTETNKGIWQTIKDILSYINPFSENFFVYKLIELLVEAIKSLFIPSDDFFSTYFSDLKNWFSDRLGFLFYPFELIFSVLNKILNINFSEPIFYIPDTVEPFTGSKIVSETTFNLNSLLSNGILKTVHNIYLICVDAFIVIKLVNLAKRKWEEVTMK